MKKSFSICLILLGAMLLPGLSQTLCAQPAEGFPAFSPEPATITLDDDEETKGFPSLNTSGSSQPKTKNAFPAFGSEKASAGSKLDFNQLGELLIKMDLEPFRSETRYDFQYLAEFEEQEMEVSLSAFVSQDGSRISVKAWLDPLPTGSIPSAPLLELLSRNTELKPGLRFGYSKLTGRFLIEKSIPNQNVNPELVTKSFQELSLAVIENWSAWSTAKWKKRSSQKQTVSKPSESISDERFELPIRR